jgi:hypothetical protein
MYKNFMASFSMCLWFTLEAVHISRALRLCCGFVISILSYLIGQLKALQKTCFGGQRFRRFPSLAAPFPSHSPYTTQQHSQMRAQGGEHGGCILGGPPSMDRKTLAGPKQLVLSFSFNTLSPWIDRNDTSESTAITRESLMDGKMGAAAMRPSIKCSAEYLSSYMTSHLHTLSTRHTSPVVPTQPIPHHEEFMLTKDLSLTSSPSPIHCAASFMIPLIHPRNPESKQSCSLPSSAHLLSTISAASLVQTQ